MHFPSFLVSFLGDGILFCNHLAHYQNISDLMIDKTGIVSHGFKTAGVCVTPTDV